MQQPAGGVVDASGERILPGRRSTTSPSGRSSVRRTSLVEIKASSPLTGVPKSDVEPWLEGGGVEPRPARKPRVGLVTVI